MSPFKALPLLLAVLLLSGCSQSFPAAPEPSVAETRADIRPGLWPARDLVAEDRERDLGNRIDGRCNSVEDLVTESWFDTVLVVEFLSPGEYKTIVEGDISVTTRGDQIIEADFHTYTAETQATVLEVLKGNSALSGSTITIAERMCKVDSETWISRYLSDETMTRALICAHYDNSHAYICATPEWQIIKINDDDTLEIWPFLEHADTCSTLSAFREMAEDTLRHTNSAAYLPRGTVRTFLFTPEQKTALTEMLNDPQNNGLLRSEYDTFPEIDLDEALILTSLPTDEVTGSECAAYAAQTGQTAGTLLKISNTALSAYLQEKFGAAPDAFETFTWVYLEAYDAWYHAPYTSEPLQVTVTSGTVTGEQYLIRYSFTRDGRTVHGSAVYEDFGDVTWFQSNIYINKEAAP